MTSFLAKSAVLSLAVAAGLLLVGTSAARPDSEAASALAEPSEGHAERATAAGLVYYGKYDTRFKAEYAGELGVLHEVCVEYRVYRNTARARYFWELWTANRK